MRQFPKKTFLFLVLVGWMLYSIKNSLQNLIAPTPPQATYQSTNKTPSVAYLKKKTGTIKARTGSQFDWRLLNTNDPIFLNETLIAGSGTAKIRLNTGGIIEIHPRTLVSLQENTNVKKPGKYLLEFNGMKIAAYQLENPLRVRTSVRILSVKANTYFELIKKNNDAYIMKVGQKKGSPLKHYLVTRANIKELRGLQPLSPRNLAVFRTKKNTLNINFHWVGQKGKFVQTSELLNFHKYLKHPSRKPYYASAQLGPGKYYWRVAGGDKYSPVQSFRIIKEKTIDYNKLAIKEIVQDISDDLKAEREKIEKRKRTLASIKSTTLPFLRLIPPPFATQSTIAKAPEGEKDGKKKATGMKLKVRFTWQPVSRATAYIIEVSTDRNFSKSSFEMTTELSDIQTKLDLKSGKTYFWRVASLGPDGKIGRWGAPNFLTSVP